MIRTIRILLILFSITFAVRVISIFTADRLYSMSMAAEKGSISPETALKYIDIATNLDSTNADLYFQKYQILELSSRALVPSEVEGRPEAESRDLKNEIQDTRYEIRKQQLHLLRTCIDLCPTWPRYHLTYAMTLERMSPTPNLMTRQKILSELQEHLSHLHSALSELAVE